VAGRVSPTERLRAEIDELFASDRELASILEDVARLSVRSMLQTALEAEVEEFLGRARDQRRTDQGRPGSGNGWQPPAAVKPTMGPIELQRPKLRGTDEAFCSRLFGVGVTRSNALELLVISGWVRGLSDRDIEGALAEVLGAEAALSRSTVSRICQRIRRSSRPGGTATWAWCGWITCSWMAATPRCIQARRPSRCWPPGASTATASRCS
jgi:putative transposase